MLKSFAPVQDPPGTSNFASADVVPASLTKKLKAKFRVNGA